MTFNLIWRSTKIEERKSTKLTRQSWMNMSKPFLESDKSNNSSSNILISWSRTEEVSERASPQTTPSLIAHPHHLVQAQAAAPAQAALHHHLQKAIAITTLRAKKRKKTAPTHSSRLSQNSTSSSTKSNNQDTRCYSPS